MKKIWLFSAAAALILAACSDTANVTKEINAPVEEVVEETPAASKLTEETMQQPTQGSVTTEVTEPTTAIEEADAETVDEEVPPVHEADAETVEGTPAEEIEPSGEVTYTQNNETYSAPTNFTTSSEQPYGLEVMDGFTLVAEEPGKDQLLYSGSEGSSMTIETFMLGETTYDDLFASAMEKAGSLGEVAPIEDLPMSDNIANIAAFEVNINGEYVVVIALETPTILAQFTLMDTAERKFLDAMMQMAVTIQGQ